MARSSFSLRTREILVGGLVLVLLALGVAHVMSLGFIVEPVEWVILYVLVGFLGGLIFYLIDPFHSQEFKWKGVVNLGGGAAVGASFMLIAKLLTPDAPVVGESEFYPAIVPVHQSIVLGDGDTMKVLEIRSLSDDKLVELFQGMLTSLNAEIGSDPTDIQKKQLLSSFLRELQLHLALEPFKERLDSLADRYLSFDRAGIDGDWEGIIAEHMKKRCSDFSECKITFNRVPYAVYALGEGSDARAGVVLPGTVLKLRNREYEVLTFANPRRKYSEEIGLKRPLFEGLVIGARVVPGKG